MDASPDGARAPRLAAWALVAATALAFAPALPGAFVWDDRHLIEVNPLLDDLANLPRILAGGFWSFGDASLDGGHVQRYYRPFISLTYLLVARATDRAPWAFHLLNLLAHLACVELCLRWLRGRLPAAAPWAALAGACVFALHPSRVESVAWISGATDVWMTLWILVAREAAAAPGARATALTAGASLLALFCKETAVVTPALLAADAWLLASPGRPAREGVARAGWAALAVAVGVAVHQWRVPFSADAVAAEGSAPARVLATLGCYALRAAWPWPLSVLAGRVEPDALGRTPMPAAWVAAGALVALAAAALALAAWRRPALRPWLADALWFLVPVAPALNLVPLGLDALASDRFLYLPMLGAAALVARGLAAAPERAAVASFGVAAAAFGFTVARGAEHLLTEVDLWSHEHRVRPASAFVAERLGVSLLGAGRPREALALARVVAARAAGAAPVERNRLSLLAAQAIVQGAPDADRETLSRARDFYEAVAAAAPGARVEVDTRHGPLRYVGAPVDSRRVFNGLVLPRAQARLRAGAYADAEAMARELLRRHPRVLPLWSVVLAARAAQGRPEDALRALRQRDAALGGAAPGPLHAALQAWAARPDDVAAQARALLTVRAYQRAREALADARARRPDDPEVRSLQATVEALDRQWDAADALLAAMARDLPAHAGRAGAMRQEVAALRAEDRGL